MLSNPEVDWTFKIHNYYEHYFNLIQTNNPSFLCFRVGFRFHSTSLCAEATQWEIRLWPWSGSSLGGWRNYRIQGRLPGGEDYTCGCNGRVQIYMWFVVAGLYHCLKGGGGGNLSYDVMERVQSYMWFVLAGLYHCLKGGVGFFLCFRLWSRSASETLHNW